MSDRFVLSRWRARQLKKQRTNKNATQTERRGASHTHLFRGMQRHNATPSGGRRHKKKKRDGVGEVSAGEARAITRKVPAVPCRQARCLPRATLLFARSPTDLPTHATRVGDISLSDQPSPSGNRKAYHRHATHHKATTRAGAAATQDAENKAKAKQKQQSKMRFNRCLVVLFCPKEKKVDE